MRKDLSVSGDWNNVQYHQWEYLMASYWTIIYFSKNLLVNLVEKLSMHTHLSVSADSKNYAIPSSVIFGGFVITNYKLFLSSYFAVLLKFSKLD